MCEGLGYEIVCPVTVLELVWVSDVCRTRKSVCVPRAEAPSSPQRQGCSYRPAAAHTSKGLASRPSWAALLEIMPHFWRTRRGRRLCHPLFLDLSGAWHKALGAAGDPETQSRCVTVKATAPLSIWGMAYEALYIYIYIYIYIYSLIFPLTDCCPIALVSASLRQRKWNSKGLRCTQVNRHMQVYLPNT